SRRLAHAAPRCGHPSAVPRRGPAGFAPASWWTPSPRGGKTMATAPPRHNDRSRSAAPSGVVLRNDAETHDVEVSRALNQWAVTVTSLGDNRTICQDFFNRRWEAMARAEDFVRLLNR